MRKFFISFLFIVLCSPLFSQHDGLKPMIDLEKEGYARLMDATKVTKKGTKVCKASVYYDFISINCGGSVKSFSLLYKGKVYKTEKGKLIEAHRDGNTLILHYSSKSKYVINWVL